MAKTILVPIDLNHDKTFERVFAAVREQADKAGGARIRLVTVVPNFSAGMFPYVSHEMIDETRAEAENRLQALGRQWLGDDIEWTAEVHVGAVARSIVDSASERNADLIVMASHDPASIDLLLGSVADQVVRRAHCSVLIVRQ